MAEANPQLVVDLDHGEIAFQAAETFQVDPNGQLALRLGFHDVVHRVDQNISIRIAQDLLPAACNTPHRLSDVVPIPGRVNGQEVDPRGQPSGKETVIVLEVRLVDEDHVPHQGVLVERLRFR